MRVHSRLDLTPGEWQSLPKETRDHIRTSLTYTNPKFAQAQRLGFATHHLPKDLYTFRLPSEGGISIDRGEARKVFNALSAVPFVAEFSLEDGTVESPIEIEYTNAEFALDERQERCLEACMSFNQGIIHAATSAGKSAMMMALIAQKKQKTLIIINRKILLEQLKRDAERWLGAEHVGTIVGGKCQVGNVTFALERSLIKHLDAVKDLFGMVIMDEVHGSPAQSFQTILSEVPARYRYGFTGTVKRKDQMQFLMYAAFGPIIATVTRDELEEAGRTTPVRVEIHETNITVDPEIFEMDVIKKNREIEKAVHTHEARFGDVCALVDGLLSDGASPRRIAVASRFLYPLERIGEILASNYPKIRFRFVTGKEKNQDENCQALERGECDVILATIPCFSTGVNVPSLSDLILISPVFTNELILHQLRGRLMRKAEGKEVGTFHFLFDGNIFERHKLLRMLAILKR